MRGIRKRAGIAIAAVLAVTACGGDGSQSAGGSVPAPVARNSPPPVSPPGNQFTLAGSPFHLQQSAPTTFHVYGYIAQSAAGAFDNVLDPASIDGTIPLGVRLVSTSDIRLSIGTLGEATMTPNGGGGIGVDGRIVQLGFNALSGSGSLGLLYGAQTQPLMSTAWLYWSRVSGSGGAFPLEDVFLVYGVTTPPGDVPRSGMVRYNESSASTMIEIDFTTGVVTGTLQRADGAALTLTGGALTADRSGFGGRITSADGQVDTTIEGRFTGPLASELMYRWIHPRGSGRPVGVGAMKRMS